jgi:hypothetical protein
MPSAALAVFAIPEVFQNILLELPVKDLLLLQRVSPYWRDTITNSRALQENLFFRAITDVKHRPQFNPLLKKHFPYFFKASMGVERGVFGPTFAGIDSDKILHEDASWRKMLPVQPPAALDDIEEYLHCSCEQHPVNRYGTVREGYAYLHEDGATMGFIWDIAAHLLDNASDAWVSVTWNLKEPASYPKSSLKSDKGVTRIIDVQNTFDIECQHDVPHHFPADDPSGMAIVELEPGMIRWQWVRKEWLAFLEIEEEEDLDDPTEFYELVMDMLQERGYWKRR